MTNDEGDDRLPLATAAIDMTVIGERYRLDGLIGAGGTADVMKAHDLVLDRPVALKILRETTDFGGDRDRFLAETRTLAQLSHPGLVTVLDAGTFNDRPFLVMELVEGTTLADALKAPVSLGELARIGSALAAALDYAHHQGVVHRDVKPGNVLIGRDGRVQLADFGIARILGTPSNHTRTGIVIGSVHYLAPEQVAFEEITGAVDVYGLGLLLLRVLTGRHAFDGPTIEAALARLTCDPDVPEEMPAPWRELLTAMTARDPEKRPSAEAVRQRLAELKVDADMVAAGATTVGSGSATAVMTAAANVAPAASPTLDLLRYAWQRARHAARNRAVPPALAGAALLAAALFTTAAMSDDAPASAPDRDPLAGRTTMASTDASTSNPAQVADLDPTRAANQPATVKTPKAKATKHSKAKKSGSKKGKDSKGKKDKKKRR